jgi:hypothetical protein
MLPKWIIEVDSIEDGPQKLATAARAAGCEVVDYKYVPFEPDPKLPFGKRDCVVAYGSIQFTKMIQRSTAWTPGVWCDWDKLRCSTYLTHWGDFSIHTNFGFYPLDFIYKNHLWLFTKFGRSYIVNEETPVQNSLFIRPDSNAKEFNGEVITNVNFDKWWSYAKCYDPSPYLMCLVSKPTYIKREWRLIIADNEVITASQYKDDTDTAFTSIPGCPDEVKYFAENIASVGKEWNYEPARIYTMDVADTQRAGLRLLEIGSVNCAGLCACDLTRFVSKANDIALEEFKALGA